MFYDDGYVLLLAYRFHAKGGILCTTCYGSKMVSVKTPDIRIDTGVYVNTRIRKSLNADCLNNCMEFINTGKALPGDSADRFSLLCAYPASIGGAGSFWEGMIDYVSGDDLEKVMKNIDNTWPE